MKSKVGCILVLYNPNWSLATKVIKSIYSQVDILYVIDNSPQESINKLPDLVNLKYHYLGGNKGIAYAQNIGINLLKADNLDFCFFLDQDSIVEDGMVNNLLKHYEELNGKGICVGAIGPRPINRQQGKEYRGSVKKGIAFDENTTEVTELISSASLIPAKHFEVVGGMDESLFIDGVDHEWCWRCSYLINARFFISEKNHLSHQLGEGDREFLWRKVAIPTPFRTYFQFRNYFILSKRRYVPLYWKLSNGIKYCIKMFYFPLFIPPRREYIKQILRGIYDGLKDVFNTSPYKANIHQS